MNTNELKITIFCDCTCGNHSNTAPAAYRVNRAGEVLNVCTRCVLTTDIKLGIAFDVATTPIAPFIEFDFIGAVVLASDVTTSIAASVSIKSNLPHLN